MSPCIFVRVRVVRSGIIESFIRDSYTNTFAWRVPQDSSSQSEAPVEGAGSVKYLVSVWRRRHTLLRSSLQTHWSTWISSFWGSSVGKFK